MADKELDRIRQLAKNAQANSPSSEDLAEAECADPILVSHPGGEPAFWLVPFLRGDMAAGFATVTLEGKVERVGSFGSGPDDRDSWIPAEYFLKPPAALLNEVRKKYAGSSLSDPLFTYDRSPLRWGWRIEVEQTRGDVVFVSPSDWYVTKVE